MKWESFSVNVFRWSLGDCTNGGVSAKQDSFTAYLSEEDAEKAAAEGRAALVLRSGPLGTVNLTPPKSQWPKGQVGPMKGGNYAGGDSRFGQAVQRITGWTNFYGLVAIHDRFESQELNDMMSH